MLLGFDIGGTKCAVITADYDGENIKILSKEKIANDLTIAPTDMIDKLITLADGIIGEEDIESVGIACGGPLDSEKGIILGPPNLKGWFNVKISEQIKAHYNTTVNLQNDANACAVAEWKFGAGKGSKNMVFLTFGTGLGAGLILDNKLYSGTNDNAGEVGHFRLDRFGPVGFGKTGSFEGFCSGGGIAQLGLILAKEQVQNGNPPLYYKPGTADSDVSAKTIADAADKGDETAIRVYSICGEYLGNGLSLIIDILNPEKIVIGSIFVRAKELLWNSAKKVIDIEAIPVSAKCCEVVPAGLGEQIGDYAAIATALL